MSKIDGMIPIQVYVDRVTHKKLKLRAFHENNTMSRMICGILLKETFAYDDSGLRVEDGMLPEGMTVADLGLPEDKTLKQKEKEYQEYVAQQEKAKGIVASFLRPSSSPSPSPSDPTPNP